MMTATQLCATRSSPEAQRSLILLTMCLGILIAQVDTSVVNLALAPIGTALDAPVSVLQWVIDAYNLVYASLLLMAGDTQAHYRHALPGTAKAVGPRINLTFRRLQA